MPDTPGTRASLLVLLRDPGDGIAWNRFVDLYAPLIYGFRRHGLQDADAADLSQDVLARCWRNSPAGLRPGAWHVSRLAVHGRAQPVADLGRSGATAARGRGSGRAAG